MIRRNRRRRVVKWLSVLGAFLLFFVIVRWKSGTEPPSHSLLTLDPSHGEAVEQFWETVPIIRVNRGEISTIPHNNSCNHYNCFNPYRCGYYGNDRMTVYVYPLAKYVDENSVVLNNEPGREFLELLIAILQSEYYEPNPDRACLFVSSVDTLSLARHSGHLTGLALSSHKWWNKGENHLLFTAVLPGITMSHDLVTSSSELGTGLAVIAGGAFDASRHFRPTFDVSIPLFNPLMRDVNAWYNRSAERQAFLLSAQISIEPGHKSIIQDLRNSFKEKVLVLEACSKFHYLLRCTDDGVSQSYVKTLQNSEFCLLIQTSPLWSIELFDALKFGCIPVVVSDKLQLPFSEVLDWRRAAVLVYKHDFSEVVSILSSVSKEERCIMRRVGEHYFREYFSSMASIALTTLRIMSDRIFAQQARLYHEWNELPWHAQNAGQEFVSPFWTPFIPREVPNEGFTAVILTYDRVPSLFRLIKQLSPSKYLRKVVIVWNNQGKQPPKASSWPEIDQPIKVIKQKSNKLSNRFLPFKAIGTEAILSLDDDITTLNVDEIDFGYQVWREFPEHLVGYPGRMHIVDNVTGFWRYDSEWRNEQSIILTGAAFYHKYYNYLYTKKLPNSIKQWVDDHMNCEDIAMNFLISNYSGKPTIKVTPRKKFRCVQCSGVDDISTDPVHMAERSECLIRFSRVFGYMPLKVVEFRADPLLHKVEGMELTEQMYPGVGPV